MLQQDWTEPSPRIFAESNVGAMTSTPATGHQKRLGSEWRSSMAGLTLRSFKDCQLMEASVMLSPGYSPESSKRQSATGGLRSRLLQQEPTVTAFTKCGTRA